MKKFLSAVLAVTFIVGLCGCGDNKTKEKLYGTSLISASNPGGGNNGASSSASSSADMASAAVQAVQVGVAASNYAAPTAPRRSLKKVPAGPTYNSATGFFTATYEGSEVQFRFLDSNGNSLAPTDGMSIELVNFGACKSVNVKMTAGTESVNLTMDTTEPMDGQITVTSGGLTYTCTITDIVTDGNGTILSGQVRVRSGGWTVALTFSGGAASGTITGPNSYTATISINEDGSGTYTDTEGPHTI